MNVEKPVNENPSLLTGFLSGAACGAVSLGVTYTADKLADAFKNASWRNRGASMMHKFTRYSPIGAGLAIIPISIAAVNAFRSQKK